MFEDYFFETTKKNKNNSVPASIYWMMQFIDFSFHENHRAYYPFNATRSCSESISTTIYKDPIDLDFTNFNDMIRTYGLIFGV